MKIKLGFLFLFLSSLAFGTAGVTILSFPKTTTTADSVYLQTRAVSPDSISRKISLGTLKQIIQDTSKQRIHDSLTVTGSFLDTITGMTTVPTATVNWGKAGPMARIQIPAQTGTSNTTACTIKTLPAVIRPASAQEVQVTGVEDNGTVYAVGTAQISTAGVITLTFATTATAAVTATFTNTGTKGWTRTLTIGYLMIP